MVAPHASPTGDLAGNPGMCPDWELTPFGSHVGTQSTEVHQPGLLLLKTYIYIYCLFLDIGKGREKGREEEGERNIDVRKTSMVACCMPPTRDQTHNPGMCPEWESNSPFAFGTTDTQPNGAK